MVVIGLNAKKQKYSILEQSKILVVSTTSTTYMSLNVLIQ